MVDDRADFVPEAVRVPRVERVPVLPGIVVVVLVCESHHREGSCMFVYSCLAESASGRR